MSSYRRIVEPVVLPTLLAALIRSVQQGLAKVDGAPLQPIIGMLDEAIREPLADMDAARQAKLSRRAMRATTAGLSEGSAESIPSVLSGWRWPGSSSA